MGGPLHACKPTLTEWCDGRQTHTQCHWCDWMGGFDWRAKPVKQLRIILGVREAHKEETLYGNTHQRGVHSDRRTRIHRQNGRESIKHINTHQDDDYSIKFNQSYSIQQLGTVSLSPTITCIMLRTGQDLINDTDQAITTGSVSQTEPTSPFILRIWSEYRSSSIEGDKSTKLTTRRQ